MTNNKILDDRSFDILFRQARTFRAWTDEDVSETLLRAAYDLAKFGPTANNCCPARFIFVRSKAAKEKLRPHLDDYNVDKVMAAPVTAIIAYDLRFHDHLPKLAPHAAGARESFEGKTDLILETALRNGSLQGAYFMLAARALGLDCGPMSGFNSVGVKAAFFPDEPVMPNFICNIGHGDPAANHPRAPRLEFDEACEIL